MLIDEQVRKVNIKIMFDCLMIILMSFVEVLHISPWSPT